MAERTRTLDEILADARAEPPVVTREEARALLAHHATNATGTSTNGFKWQGYAMVGILITAAAIVGLVLSEPDGTASEQAQPAPQHTVTAPEAAPPGAPEPAEQAPGSSAPVTGETAQQAASDKRGASAGSAATARDEKPGSAPAPGAEKAWGYRFVQGQTLYYRYTTEHSNPAVNDNFVQRREVSVYVESLDADGNATMLIRRLSDTLIREGKMMLPDFIVVERPASPELMRATVSPTGDVLDGRIVVDRRGDSNRSKIISDADYIRHWVQEIFAPLPEATRLSGNGPHRDTATRAYKVPTFDGEGTMSMVMNFDTTLTSYSLLGSRRVGDIECRLLVVNESTVNVSDREYASKLAHEGPPASRSATVKELYLRSSDRLPVRVGQTGTTQDDGGSGSSHRSTLELLREEIHGTSPSIEHSEGLR